MSSIGAVMAAAWVIIVDMRMGGGNSESPTIPLISTAIIPICISQIGIGVHHGLGMIGAGVKLIGAAFNGTALIGTVVLIGAEDDMIVMVHNPLDCQCMRDGYTWGPSQVCDADGQM